jgi:hypothetical protein
MGSGVDRETLEKSYENVMTEAFYPKSNIKPGGAEDGLEDISERDPRAKTVKPEQSVDFSFIKELDGNGFIDGL